MSELPPTMLQPTVNYQSGTLIDRDQEHMKILSVCWYIVSGLAALGGFFPLFYVVMGVIFLKMPSAMGAPGAPPPPAFMGVFMIIFGLCFSLFIWTMAVMGFFTARAMGQRRRLMLCYFTAGLACLSVPIGTILGVFTFVVLSRPTVRGSFPS